MKKRASINGSIKSCGENSTPNESDGGKAILNQFTDSLNRLVGVAELLLHRQVNLNARLFGESEKEMGNLAANIVHSPSGKPIAVVAIKLALEDLTRLLNELDLAQGKTLSLVDWS